MKEIIKLACVVALSLAGCAVLLELHGLIRDTRADEKRIANETETLIQTAQQASDAAVQAEKAQFETLNHTSAEVYKTTAAARLVLVRLDKSLNDELGPRLASSITDTDLAIRNASQNLSAIAAGLQPTIQNSAEATTRLNALLASQEIPQSLANLADSTRQFDGVSIDAKKAADMAVQKEYEMLHPPAKKLAVKLLEFFGGHVVEGTEMWYYLTH